MDANPRVSVVVPNYNHASFLQERIESILQQTYTDREIILLDDASTDGSLEILRRYASVDRIRLIENESNSGSPFAQWNRGVEAARGEYVWIAESDDSSRPEFLAEMVAALDAHSTAALVQCGSLKIDSEGTVLGPLVNDAFPGENRWSTRFVTPGREEIQQYLYLQNTIPSASAVLFRKSSYLQAGLADVSYRLSGDWWQWVRMLQHGDYCHLPEPMNFSRIHQKSQRSAGSSDGRLEWESLNVQHHLRQSIAIDREMVRRAADRMALSWLQAIRSGRYNGPLIRHLQILKRLYQADLRTGLLSTFRLPWYFAIWLAKNTLFRSRRDSGQSK